jgi:hypothetical protein
MAHSRAQYGTDLQSTSQDMLTALDRSAMALNMIAHTLENEFAERFGHTGVSLNAIGITGMWLYVESAYFAILLTLQTRLITTAHAITWQQQRHAGWRSTHAL